MSIITNNIDKNHLETLQEYFKVSDEIFIAVAFFKKSGFDLLSMDLKKSLKKGSKITFVCGLDFYQTEPDALKAMYSLTKKHNKCKLLIQNPSSKSTFHPKFYYFKNITEVTLLIGSANFTRGGFKSNFEVSLTSKFEKNSNSDKEVQNLITSIEKNCIEYSDIEISNYARKYQIFKRNKNSAERISEVQTKALFNLDKDKLEEYLEDYKKDIKEQKDLKRRNENYLQAKKILEIIRTKKLSNYEFFDCYEKLVGKAGVKSLWHSGSIFRGKESVKKFKVEFKAMLNDIVENIDKKPSEIIEQVEKYFKSGHEVKIDGLGPNIITEILNTYSPNKFAVLNQNPLTSIKYLGFEEFPTPQSFKPKHYQDFTTLLSGIMNGFQFETLGQVDHFLNYIYWIEKNKE